MTKSCDSPIATCGFPSACVPSPFVTKLPVYLLPHPSFEDDMRKKSDEREDGTHAVENTAGGIHAADGNG